MAVRKLSEDRHTLSLPVLPQAPYIATLISKWYLIGKLQIENQYNELFKMYLKENQRNHARSSAKVTHGTQFPFILIRTLG